MQHRFMIWVIALLVTGRCSTAAADEVYLACHTGVALAAGDARDVFLGEKQYSNATKLAPVDNAAVQTAFLERVLAMSRTKYSTTWAKKSFRDGVNPPVVLANDSAVLEFIRRTPGGCGYLAAEPPADVAAIGKF